MLNLLPASDIVLIGPTFSFKFGAKCKKEFWIGLEYSRWENNRNQDDQNGDYDNNGYIAGFDFALEYEIKSRKIRSYSEMQFGMIDKQGPGFYGISCGPVAEYDIKKDDFTPGLQATVWGGFFLLGNIRFKTSDKMGHFNVGAMAKIPLRGITIFPNN